MSLQFERFPEEKRRTFYSSVSCQIFELLFCTIYVVYLFKYLHFPVSFPVITLRINIVLHITHNFKWRVIGAPAGFAYLYFNI